MSGSQTQIDFSRRGWQGRLLQKVNFRKEDSRASGGRGTSPLAMKMVLVKIDEYAREDGWCWVSQQNLATECCMTQKTLRNAINRLRDLCLLRVQKRISKAGNRQYQYQIYWNSLQVYMEEREAELADDSDGWVDVDPETQQLTLDFGDDFAGTPARQTPAKVAPAFGGPNGSDYHQLTVVATGTDGSEGRHQGESRPGLTVVATGTDGSDYHLKDNEPKGTQPNPNEPPAGDAVRDRDEVEEILEGCLGQAAPAAARELVGHFGSEQARHRAMEFCWGRETGALSSDGAIRFLITKGHWPAAVVPWDQVEAQRRRQAERERQRRQEALEKQQQSMRYQIVSSGRKAGYGNDIINKQLAQHGLALI